MEKLKKVVNKLFVAFSFFLVFIDSFAATYTMGTSGSQSATITATSGSPDKFYDNGGSGSNYSNSVDATYTFNCAAGKYVRIKVNSCTTESSYDYFYAYDGATTSARFLGDRARSGSLTSSMYVGSTGSLTIKFTSDGSNTNTGWDIDVWIDDYPGQLWDGSSSVETSTAANWEGSVKPYDHFANIYIPSGLTNYPDQSNSSSNLYVYDLTIETGATFTYSSTATSHTLFVYGDIVVNGTLNHTGSYYIQCNGGTSSSYATISGTGDMSLASYDIGYNKLAYYKLNASVSIYDFYLENTIGASSFDMNTYNLTTYYYEITSSTLFYQRTGTLNIGESSSIIDNTAFVEATGTTVFNRSGTQTVPAITYYNLSTSGSGTKTFGASTVDVDGVLTIGAGTTLATGNYNCTIAGNWVNNGTAFTAGTGTVTFDGTSTISGSTVTTFNNVIITGTYTGASSGTLNLGGNWTNNGTFNHNSGTVVFNGSSAQTLGGSSASTFNNLTISNSSTGVSLGVNSIVNSTLNFTAGLLKTVSYTLTIGTNASNGSVTNANSSRYIVAYDNAGTIGYVKMFVNSITTYSLPIGDASNYTPMTWILNSHGGLASAYLTTYTKATYPTGMNASLTQYINRYWDLTSSGITSPNYDVSYTYVDGDIVGGTETNLMPFKITGSTVIAPSNSTFTNVSSTVGTGSITAGSNLLSWTGVTSFSKFGGAVNGAIALPIELLSFEAKPYQGNVKINWRTANEINNDFFNVERSDDGEEFRFVCEVDGAGNSNYVISYFYIDAAYRKGINYYRLKQVDYNGEITYSKIITVDMSIQTGQIIMTVNSLGQEVNETYNGIVFDIYADGSSVKRIQ
ncbi:MAG: hypothetical protein HYR91_00395 [Flavobacteriia bacterium]|nr:hypothetical protein [Flavobacteriia bacterium]